ncbi:Membrane carboxypeptidase (penicillin-binding protein) [Nonomuraea maritima]|uniref:Membrane carboxypeptidase (Penicillin-binding protein) n=1 Tax=Nonomuraea maritima TaxID=683260 RepID=A0A1G9LCF6_9ACTN|nr:transglycosylase domain-containing protein [Nonomuraea maritima]SDL59574.1 Membrane carboxypeptidase (penicillin-binding protein) [Nonomuraea maritima]
MQAQRKDRANPVLNVLRLLIAGAAAGVLTAAVALPAIGGAGISTKTAVEGLNLKPEQLEEPPLSEVTELFDTNGDRIGRFYFENRESVTLDKVAPIMRTALIAIEDFRFYQHGPIDVEGTTRALVKNLTSGGVMQGGSSITQQYVKQVLVNKAETPEEQAAAIAPTVSRKLSELRYAMAIEEKYSKDQILEKYLNIAYFGAGAHGIQAASKRFFDKPASKLNLVEAATLAGAVQNPARTDPNVGSESRARLLERRNVVLDRMAELGKITHQQAAEAKKKKLGYKDIEAPGGCEESKYPYFCLYVQYEILNNEAFGKNQDERRKLLQRGGLRIKTTIDPKMQAAADKAIRKYVSTKDKPVASQAMIVPGTGEIKAMAASRKYGRSKSKNEMSYNIVADGAHGGGRGFQQGSTAKVYTLAAALEEGMKYEDGFPSPAGYQASGYSSFKNCKGQNVGDPSHTVRNSSEGGGGFKTLQTGTWGSVNTFFVRLQEKVGLCDVVKMAKKLGVKRADGQKLSEVETFTLGVNEVDPVTIANAYAVFASRGKYCKPLAITAVTDRYGKTTQYKPKCSQVLDEKVADAVNGILSGVFTKGTMTEVGGIGRDAAGKTGTTDNYMSAWFAGYTPNLASAVSLGDPRGTSAHKLIGITIGGRYYTYVYGASISGRIWKDSMLTGLKGVEPTKFTAVDKSRFGGCSSNCAPKPPKKKRDDGPRDPFGLFDNGRDGGGDGPGDRDRGNGWRGGDGPGQGRGNGGRGHDAGPIVLDG